MPTAVTRNLASLVSLALLIACRSDFEQPVLGIQAMSFSNSEWSEPVNLGPPINSQFLDAAPTLSKDGLHLYFTSIRPGGFGLQDIWVSQRACVEVECPWGTPVNLGPRINTAAVDAGANLSADEHLLFFFSSRPGGHGSTDIWVSHRADPKDDFGWEDPVNLGPDVNTTNSEAGPSFLRHEGDGDGTLYFYRGDPPITTDLYAVRVTKDGETLGPAVAVPGLNSTVEDNHASVRRDGREIFFNSRRPGAVGGAGFDIWVATRENGHDPWSTPANLGEPVNSRFAEFHPNLSFDGRTLLFISGGARGGLGGFDIWMTTRTVNGK